MTAASYHALLHRWHRESLGHIRVFKLQMPSAELFAARVLADALADAVATPGSARTSWRNHKQEMGTSDMRFRKKNRCRASVSLVGKRGQQNRMVPGVIAGAACTFAPRASPLTLDAKDARGAGYIPVNVHVANRTPFAGEYKYNATMAIAGEQREAPLPDQLHGMGGAPRMVITSAFMVSVVVVLALLAICVQRRRARLLAKRMHGSSPAHFPLFEELPDDAVQRVAEVLFEERMTNIAGLCQTNQRLRRSLDHLRKEAEKTWLCWQPKCTMNCRLLDGSLTAQRTRHPSEVGPGYVKVQHTAAGGLLPAGGRYSWRIHVGRSAADCGMLAIGVCDAGCHCGWGLRIGTGEVHVQVMTGCGPPARRLDYGVRLEPSARLPLESSDVATGGREPEGAVNMECWQALPRHEALGYRNPANSSANVEVLVDRYAGAVTFRLNGGSRSASLVGFPPGVPLRPWVSLDSIGGHAYGDLVTFASPLQLEGEDELF